MHRRTGRRERPHRGPQPDALRERADVLLGEAAGEHERGRAVREPGVAERVDHHDLGPRRRQQLDVLGVPERERRTAEHPDPHRLAAAPRPTPGRARPRQATALRLGSCAEIVAPATISAHDVDGRPRRAVREGAGRRRDRVEVDVRGDQLGHGVDRRDGGRPVLGRGHQPQMPRRHGERVAAGQGAEDRQPDLGGGGAQHLLVAGRPDPVQHHPREVDPRVERPEAVQQSGEAAGLAARVDDQHDRRPQQPGDLSGGAVAVGQPTVEEPHHALDDGDLRSGRAVAGQRGDPVGADEHRVEVAAGTARGERVVAGVDVVRAHLERRHGGAATAQRGHEPGRHRRLPRPGRGRPHDEGARAHRGGPVAAG